MLSAAPEGDPLLDELDLDEPDLSEAVSEEAVAPQPEDDSNFAEPDPTPDPGPTPNPDPTPGPVDDLCVEFNVYQTGRVEIMRTVGTSW